jgi:hypothetical protein
MKLMLIFLISWSAVSTFANPQKLKKQIRMNDEIPTVAFCEMVKNPKSYFDKTIRLIAIFTQATEAQYLSDEKNCPLSHDDQIGVSYSSKDENQVADNNTNIRKIGSAEFGSRVFVTVVGSLKNQSRRDFAWYRYRFDIANFEEISHIINEYKGELEATKTYQAEVRSDKNLGLTFIIPFRPPFHQAYRIEWINLKEFSALKNFQTKEIVFSVLLKDTKQITESRWNTTLKCKIIRIE